MISEDLLLRSSCHASSSSGLGSPVKELLSSSVRNTLLSYSSIGVTGAVTVPDQHERKCLILFGKKGLQ